MIALIGASIFWTQNNDFTRNQAGAEKSIFHAYAKPTPAPNFCLEDLQGKMVDIQEYRGQVILINFWATW
jgi:hypothetical protein